MFECSRGCGASVTPRFSERGWGGSERDFIGPHRCPSPGLGWAGQPILLGVCVPNSCTSLVIYTRSKLQAANAQCACRDMELLLAVAVDAPR